MTSSPETFRIRPLEAADAAAFRTLRLAALGGDPAAFGAAWEDEAAQPVAWFAARLSAGLVLGAWQDDGMLSGIVGLHVFGGPKQRHKGLLWGMFVHPERRGQGLGTALVRALIAQAGGRVEELRLSVGADNPAACRLYAAAGFMVYGVERRALKIGAQYHDERLMALRLAGQADAPNLP